MGQELLQKFGWQKGVALGKAGGAANAPIDVHKKTDNAGIGCKNGFGSSSNNTSVAADPFIVDDSVDSEKTKAWKRMMSRYNEPR